MPESDKHLQLVSCILTHIQHVYTGIDCVISLSDLPGTTAGDKPPKIGNYRPDVYAVDAPLTRTIVGEAKTEADLDTDHTQEQIRAFVSFLRLQTQPVFILAVPWQAKPKGRNLLQHIAKELSASMIQMVVIDEVEMHGA